MPEFSTFVELLCWRARRDPLRVAYTFLKGDKELRAITHAELDRRARVIAVELSRCASPGARAVLLYPPGIEFLEAFFGCLYAGIVAIPAPPPDHVRRTRTLPRLQAIAQDSMATVILGPSRILNEIGHFREALPTLTAIRYVATDSDESTAAESWRFPGIHGEALAYLQYTSGSTSSPKGVMVTHDNLIANCRMLSDAAGLDERDVSVTWLPHFHDYGLVTALMEPLHTGYPAYMLAPLEFLKRPISWLGAMSRYKATVTGAPAFAYGHCVDKIAAAERARLDLSQWRVASVSAEYVHLETIERFIEAFGPSGFRRTNVFPSYGLAEATLVVSGKKKQEDLPSAVLVDGVALLDRRVVLADRAERRTRLVTNCGRLAVDTTVRIVNPDTLHACREDEIGEIWVASPSVSDGYWNRPEQSEQIFKARIAGTGEGPFLRTGDLGFLRGDELFFAGRLKDLVIVAGANHHPEDIERTVQNCHPAFAYSRGAAFSVEIGAEERLVIAHEVKQEQLERHQEDELFRAIRHAAAEAHDLRVHAIVLLKPGSVPRTSSNKVQRSTCRDRFLAGELSPLARWTEPRVLDEPLPQAETRLEDGQGQQSGHAAATSAGAPDIRAWLRERASHHLGVGPREIDTRAPLASYGMSSRVAVALVGEIQERFGQRISETLLYEHPTIEDLTRHLVARPDPAGTARPAEGPASSAEPIAILGIGVRFPGRTSSPEAFWRLLCDGVDAVTEVPEERWDVAGVYDPDPAAPGKTTSRWGGFLERVDEFDPYFFGISPREAARMDPQQRLMLEVTQEALDDAGLPRDSLAGSSAGVFAGLIESEYAWLTVNNRAIADAYTATGSSGAIAANRISYVYDLRGPSFTVDAVCSSSLLAVHLACQSLQRGECTVALAGGVQLMLTPDSNVWFSKLGVLSPDGRCRAFDARANGIVLSEGAAMLVLKPLSRALSDRDPIYAVIRGSAVVQDGRSNGLTAPIRRAQEMMLAEAYRRAGVAPGRVHYVDAHGTGTPLGDPIEAQALGAVLGVGRDPDRPCYLGSVKTNLGHLGTVGGVASLIKVALSVKHRMLPPSLHFQEPNSNIPMGELKLKVPQALFPWPYDEPALAGVSSLSFGGTNVHVVLEEAPRETTPAGEGSGAEPSAYLLAISACSRAALEARARDIARLLAEARAPGALQELCCSSTARQSHHDHRIAVVGESKDELEQRFQAFLRHGDDQGVYHGQVDVSGTVRGAVFVFSGQGSQGSTMGRELMETEAAFRASMERCDSLIHQEVGWSVIDALSRDPSSSRLHEMQVVQPALFAIQVALAETWRAWGIEPAAVVGHSMGEVAAAHVAGALDLPSAVRVICQRSRLLQRVAGHGGMAAAAMSVAEAEALLRDAGEDRLWIAAVNSARSVVFTGDSAALEQLVQRCQGDGIFCRLMQVGCAAHSPQLDPQMEELAASLAGIQARDPSVPFFSTVTGRLWEGGAPDAAYWTQNFRQPVLFSSAIQRCADMGHDLFLEIGPHPTLRLPIEEDLADSRHAVTVLHSLSREEPERVAMLKALGALYARGQSISWRAVQPVMRKFARLPAYPWQRERLWLPEGALGVDLTTAPTKAAHPEGHPLLGRRMTPAVESGKHYWEVALSAEQPSYLKDHRVEGAIVFPAAGHLELGLAGAREVLGGGAYELSSTTFDRMLVVPEKGSITVQMALVESGSGGAEFEILSRAPGSPEASWASHAKGRIRRLRPDASPAASVALADIFARCTEAVAEGAHTSALRKQGAEYGPSFQRISELQRGEQEAIGRLDLPEAIEGAPGVHLMHPCLLDAAFQLAFATCPRDAYEGLFVPVEVRSLRWLGAPRAPVYGHAVRRERATEATEKERQLEVDVYIYDAGGRVLVEALGLSFLDAGSRTGTGIEDLFHDVHWEAETAEPPTASPSRLGGSWLIFADPSGVGDSVGAILEARGAQCTYVMPADGYRALGSGRYQVDPAEPEELYRLLTDACLDRGDGCSRVLYLWGLTAPSPASATLASLEGAQRVGLAGALHLVQAMTRAALKRLPELWLVTAGAQPVGPEPGYPALAQAPLWGLGKVIAFEHPELCCRRLDLPPAAPDRMAGTLAEELARDEHRDELAIRAGQRFVPVLHAGRAGPRSAREGGEPAIPSVLSPAANRAFSVELPARGQIEDVRIQESSRTPPREGEVEIEVRAVGLNFLDVARGIGLIPDLAPAGGALQIGMEGSGRVVAVGRGVQSPAVGDDVMAVLPEPGFCRTHTTLSALLAVRMPPALSFDEAATLPIAFLTVLFALEHFARLEKGERVLIHAASGGVGLAAIQVARDVGAEIFATAGSEEKRRFLRELGVEHVMDSRSTSFAEEILERTGGRGVDVVLNSLSGEFMAKSLSVLAPFGRFVELGKRDILRNARLGLAPFQKNLAFFAADVAGLIREQPERAARWLQVISKRVEQGKYKPLRSSVLPVTECARGLRDMSQTRHIGKVILSLRDKESAPIAARPSLFRPDATYLITGGLGDIGLAVAGSLAASGASHLVLLGRKAPSRHAEERLGSMRQSGIEVKVVSADVADSDQMERALADLRRSMPPLRGVFHAAATLEDGLLTQLDQGRFVSVLRPKLAGSWNLHQLTRSDPLDHFVLFSSTASLLGSPGQSNYSAANAFLDALAHARRAEGLPGMSINWGPWADVGGVVRLNLEARFSSRGLGSISAREGLAALALLLERRPAQMAVLRFNPARWAQHHPEMKKTFLRRLLDTSGSSPLPRLSSLSMRQKALSTAAGEARYALIHACLRRELSTVLGIPVSRIETMDGSLGHLGMDSLMGLELRNRLEKLLEMRLPATLAWSYPTLHELTEHLLSRLEASEAPSSLAAAPANLGEKGKPAGRRVGPSAVQARVAERESLRSEPIAIIGMGCRFPGASSPQAFWRLLEEGTDAVGEMPPDRWDIDAYYDPDRAAPGKIYTRRGAFLRDIDKFDPEFFGISLREAVHMDPQQRLFLEVSWEALEDAGLEVGGLAGSKTGIFVGAAAHEYQELLFADPSTIDIHSGTGVSHGILAGRLAYLFDFRGPAMAIDTACSSGLVAVHQASQSLRSRECDMALAGGVNLLLKPEFIIAACKMGLLSPEGRCKAFDARADGIALGEGCGVVVLKRLSGALSDGDNILAVIRGSALNQDGHSAGLTAPNGSAQQAVIRTALENAGLSFAEISYVEAHGTGTVLGDPIEVAALCEVAREHADRGLPCGIGSVKTNIGHTMTAAGIAGLIKVVLSLQHEALPPHVHLGEVNTNISLEGTPFYFPRSLAPWPRAETPRYAGVSSFGWSGTNAHLVVEEAPAREGSSLHRRISVPTYPFQRVRCWPAAPAAPPPAVRAAEREELVPAAWRCRVAWRSAPRESAARAQPEARTAGSWLILADQRDVGAALAKQLEARGEQCSLLRPEELAAPAGHGESHLDVLDGVALRSLLDRVTRSGRAPLRGVVHLGGLDCADEEGMTAASLEAIVASTCGGALRLVRALAAATWAAYPRLWLVTRGAQGAPRRGAPVRASAAPLWGLGRVVAVEHAEIWGGLVDLDAAPDPEDAIRLSEELWSPSEEKQLVLRGKHRFVPRLVRDAARATPAAPVSFPADATYLITGGLGGIGLEVAAWLARRGARHLVLLGRRAAGEAAKQAIESIERAGARVIVQACDVSSAEDVARIFSSVLPPLPPLRGVVHAAGVIEDGLLLTKAWGTFDRVVRPKIYGAWNLHVHTRERPLDFFLMFSSAASLLGSPGQGDYAAGNAFLDALAHKRRAEGLPATSINWGAWTDVGMAASLDDRRNAWWRSRGMGGVSPAQGLEAISDVLREQPIQLGILPIDWPLLLGSFPPDRRPSICREIEAEVAAPQKSPVVAPRKPDMLSALQAALAGERLANIEAFVTGEVARVLRADAEQAIDPQRGFSDLGMDSLMTLELRERLEAGFGLSAPLSATLTFDHPTISTLAKHLHAGVLGLSATEEDPRTHPARTPQPGEAIAVVQVACRFPGGSGDPEAFWRLLREGRHVIDEVPADRWDNDAFSAASSVLPGTMSARHGAFLEDVGGFDAQFFGISPREADKIDPQQRLLLEVSWEALERAGTSPESLVGSKTGVFIGISTTDYLLLQIKHGDRSVLDSHTATGSGLCFAAGRLSHFLGLEGPSMAVDTACSSSLVAVHLACESLRNGGCDLALAGGVSLMLAPENSLMLSRAGALSPDGLCKTFDASADGYGRGEGCGVVVLQRLSDALAGGGDVLAVLRGSAVRHDGRSSGLTVPNGVAQEALLREVLAAASVEPREIGYVETHGTGTPLGDPIEVRALGAVLSQGRTKEAPLWLGSVKTNIGHLEAAAGIAGLIKVVLALHHREIPAHLHLKQLNPHILLDAIPAAIPAQLTSWSSPPLAPRIAGVSSFGMSGTNAHVLLAEAPRRAERVAGVDRPLHVLCLSAKTDEALQALATAYERFAAAHPHVPLGDIAFTAATGRSHFTRRLAVVAGSSAELCVRMSAFRSRTDAPRVFHDRSDAQKPLKLAFVFSGSSAVLAGMGQELYEAQGSFREAVDLCDGVLQRTMGESILPRLFPGPSADASPAGSHEDELALLVVELAFASLWRSWGIEPAAVLGDGVGEIAAACVAGALRLEDALLLVASEGRREAKKVPVSAPGVRLISCSTGATLGTAELNEMGSGRPPQGGSARAADAVRSAQQLGVNAFLEIGPRGAVSPALEALPEGTALCLPTSSATGEAWSQVLESLAVLYTRGASIRWRELDRPYERRVVTLPTYPFQRRRRWLDGAGAREAAGGRSHGVAAPSKPPWTLAGHRLRSPLRVIQFESSIASTRPAFLGDHRIHGSVVVPGAFYVAAVVSAVTEAFGGGPCLLEGVEFHHALALDDRQDRLLQLALTPKTTEETSFEVHSAAPGDEARAGASWVLHATGRVAHGAVQTNGSDGRHPDLAALQAQRSGEATGAEELYRAIRAAGVELGASFQCVESFWRCGGGYLARLRHAPRLDGAVLHPGFVDSVLQVAGAAMVKEHPALGALLPVSAERFWMDPRPGAPRWCHVELHNPDTADGQSLAADVRLLTEEGQLAGEIFGLKARSIGRRNADGPGEPTIAGGGRDPRAALVLSLAQASSASFESSLRAWLREEVARVLGFETSERVDEQESLSKLGLDSVMALDLRRRIEVELGAAVPVVQLLEEPTIVQLSAFVAAELQEQSKTDAASRIEANGNPWLLRPRNAKGRLRLLCFAHAGGGAASFMPWQAALSPEIEVCAIQLPGREPRLHEPPPRRFHPLIETLATAVLAEQDAPLAFFGHSLGAVLAFELARYAQRHGLPTPRHLILSASAPPRRRIPVKLPELDDEALIAALASYNGTPAAAMRDPEMLKLILPIVRADFELLADYRYLPGPPLDLPITVLAGREDPHVAWETLPGWQEETTQPCAVHGFDGDHFFIHSHAQKEKVIACIAETLRRP